MKLREQYRRLLLLRIKVVKAQLEILNHVSSLRAGIAPPCSEVHKRGDKETDDE